MQPAAILTGLACGALLAGVGLALWDSARPQPGLFRAVQAVAWLACALLLVGALLAWLEGSASKPALALVVMAAVAAPQNARHEQRSPWGRLMPGLLALPLAGAGLVWLSAPAGNTRLAVTPLEWAVVLCGGLGVRALGEALGKLIVSAAPVARPAPSRIEGLSAATYTLLTLLAGGVALANLAQRGSVWSGAAREAGLASAWLAWSAAWFAPRERERLQAWAIAVAAVLLILMAVR